MVPEGFPGQLSTYAHPNWCKRPLVPINFMFPNWRKYLLVPPY